MAITKIPAAGFSDAVNFRNIIINGDMSLAQRGTSSSSITSSGNHVMDRYKSVIDGAGTWTLSQSTTVPSGQGFAKSFKFDCTTADGSLAATDMLVVQQRIEGQNLQYLKKGTSSAESLTASFWVRSAKTGTYICELRDFDNNRTISQSYTISSADTWENKTLTFAGDTTGAFDNDNAASLYLTFWLAAGSNFSSGSLQTSWGTKVDANRAVGQVNLADSTSNDWYVTGVPFEAGTSASEFAFLPVDVNLNRCQRYFYMHAQGSGDELGIGCYYNSSQIALDFAFPVTMRATPSVYQTTGTDYFATYRPGVADGFNSLTAGSATTTMFGLYNNSEVSGTAQDAQFFRTANGSAKLGADAEL